MKRRDFNKSVFALTTTGTLGLNIPQMTQSSDLPHKNLPPEHQTFQIDKHRHWKLTFWHKLFKPIKIRRPWPDTWGYVFGTKQTEIGVHHNKSRLFIVVDDSKSPIYVKEFVPTDCYTTQFTSEMNLLPHNPPGTLYIHTLFCLEITLQSNIRP